MVTRHFEVLDGLRGTAAMAVVVFHLFEYIFPSPIANLLRHAYLAVDFFFLLSGFVIAHAYDARWTVMSARSFLRMRLFRLHPLVLLGLLLGLLDYVFDPFAGDSQKVGLGLLLANVALGALLLPAPALPNRFNATHSLDSPSWSLLQEYAVNIVYAVIVKNLAIRALTGLTVVAGIVLAWAAVSHGHLSAGWSWDTFWLAPIRVAFPFFAGVLLYRSGCVVPIKWGYPILSLVLLGTFMTPNSSHTGAMDAALIILLLPLIVAAGAGSEVGARMAVMCRFFGRISYPIYILHYPFVDIYAHWLSRKQPDAVTLFAVSTGLVAALVAVSWFAERYYDRPIRYWLAGRKQRQDVAANRDQLLRST